MDTQFTRGKEFDDRRLAASNQFAEGCIALAEQLAADAGTNMVTALTMLFLNRHQAELNLALCLNHLRLTGRLK